MQNAKCKISGPADSILKDASRQMPDASIGTCGQRFK